MLSNFTYTKELHYKDSDGDGVSNGDELNVILVGDSLYLMGDPLSHPGTIYSYDFHFKARHIYQYPYKVQKYSHNILGSATF